MRVGRCQEGGPTEVGPESGTENAPSVTPFLGSERRRSNSGPLPLTDGEEERSGVQASRPHTPGALWNEILINY